MDSIGKQYFHNVHDVNPKFVCLSGLEERRWIEDVSFYSWLHYCCKDDMLDVNERVGATFTFDRKSRPSPSFVTI